MGRSLLVSLKAPSNYDIFCFCWKIDVEEYDAVAFCAGTMPGELGKLTALVTLDLEGNELTGEENACGLMILVGHLTLLIFIATRLVSIEIKVPGTC